MCISDYTGMIWNSRLSTKNVLLSRLTIATILQTHTGHSNIEVLHRRTTRVCIYILIRYLDEVNVFYGPWKKTFYLAVKRCRVSSVFTLFLPFNLSLFPTICRWKTNYYRVTRSLSPFFAWFILLSLYYCNGRRQILVPLSISDWHAFDQPARQKFSSSYLFPKHTFKLTYAVPWNVSFHFSISRTSSRIRLLIRWRNRRLFLFVIFWHSKLADAFKTHHA